MSVSFIQKPARNSPLVANHPLRRGLVAAWRFDEHNSASGAILKDSCTQKTYDMAFPSARWSIANTRYGRVIDRDSTRDSAVCTMANAITLGTTYSGFVRFFFRSMPPEDYAVIWFDSGETAGFSLNGVNRRLNIVHTSADHFLTNGIVLNTWYNIVFSCLKGTLTGYVNGMADATVLSSVPSTTVIKIGSDASNERFDGQFGAMAFWVNHAIGRNGARMLNQDPFTLWRPQPVRQYVGNAAAVAAATSHNLPLLGVGA